MNDTLERVGDVIAGICLVSLMACAVIACGLFWYAVIDFVVRAFMGA